MRRALIGGYDRDQVDAALRERDRRLGELEREARDLGERVAEAERLAGSGRFVAPGTGGGLSRRLEEMQEHARRRAERIRAGAQEAAQVAERVSEISKLRAEMNAVVAELAGLAGTRVGRWEGGAPVGTESAGVAAERLYSGAVEVQVGSLRDFAQLTSFEDAVSSIDSATEVEVRNFTDGRATFSMNFAQPVELVQELGRRAPFPFGVRSASADGVVLDLNEGDRAA